MASRFAENEYEIETSNNMNDFIMSDHDNQTNADRLNAEFGVNSDVMGKYEFAGDKHAYLNSHPLFKFQSYKSHPCYEFIKEIGRGGYGEVIKVKWKNSVFKELKFALKRCNLSGDEQLDKKQLNEVEINMQLKHLKIAYFHNYWIEIDEKPTGYIAIWLNLIIEEHDKSLEDWINENAHRDYNECLLIFLMIADGLRYVHSQGFIHRDLKPGNILMNGNVMQGGKVKIADFGLSTFHSAKQDSTNNCHTSTGGEGIYSAPEMENGKQYNEKADVYSLGLILFELLAEFKDEKEKRESILGYKESKSKLSPKIFKSPSHQVERDIEIILRLTEINFTQRATSEEAYDYANDLLASFYYVRLNNPQIPNISSGEFQGTWVARGEFAEVFPQKFTHEKKYALIKIALKTRYHPINARIVDQLVEANKIWLDNNDKSFIVPFYCQFNMRENMIYAQMVLCKDSLETLNENNTFNNEDTLRLFFEISIGLNYLHDRRIIHRDMKPSNIFLGYDGKWKISDYCLAIIRLQHYQTEADYYEKCEDKREPFYAAPEQTMNEDGRDVNFKLECKIDIFAFGLIMISLITSTLRDKSKLFNALKNVRNDHKLPDDMNKKYGLIDLIFEMTQRDPLMRPDIFQVKIEIEKSNMGNEMKIFNLAEKLINFESLTTSEHRSCVHLLEEVIKMEEQGGTCASELTKTLTNEDKCLSQGVYLKLHLLEQFMKILEKKYGPYRPEVVALTLRDLANLFLDGSHRQEWLEQVLKVQQTHYYGDKHTEVAITLANLASACASKGDYQKQRNFLERVMKIQEEHYGQDHLQVAKTLVNLSSAFKSLGDNNKQRDSLERAMKIQEKHYGQDHPEVIKTLRNLYSVKITQPDHSIIDSSKIGNTNINVAAISGHSNFVKCDNIKVIGVNNVPK